MNLRIVTGKAGKTIFIVGVFYHTINMVFFIAKGEPICMKF